MKRIAFWVFLIWGACAYAAEQAVNTDLREPVFADAQAALAKANEQMANVLAPTSYSKAADGYRRAESIFKDGGKINRIQKLLETSTEHFLTAASSAEANRETLSLPLAARADAEEAGAETHADALWREAEVALFEAATRLEAGRDKAAVRYIERAEANFREAELQAIDTSLLSETEALIAAAKEADADDYAPRSYVRAVELLAEARQSLAQDRYDTDRPRGLASDALHHAKRARYIAVLWQAIDDRDVTFEDAIGVYEAEIKNTASLMDLAVHFDDGPGDASKQIGDALLALQLKAGQQENQLSEAARHASLLQEEVDRLQAELGGQSRARDRLQAELARQQRLKDRVRRVEDLFRADQAQVLRVEDRLVLRLLALNFASGKAEIRDEHGNVLAKLIEALAQFPETPIIVEGHTDSYGADLTNLDLSNKRAEAVAQYLLDNSPLSPALVTSVGYGESKPIANNESSEGRAKNRRIDVVLYPNW